MKARRCEATRPTTGAGAGTGSADYLVLTSKVGIIEFFELVAYSPAGQEERWARS